MKLTEFEIDNLIKDNILLKERVKQLKIDKEKLKEQLALYGVGFSEVFARYGKPFTSGRDLWDWLKDNCNVILKN